MQDAHRGGVAGGSRRARDGGGDGVWRAGDTPPAPPDDPTELADRLGAGGTGSDRQFVVRVSLDQAGEAVARRVVAELRSEVDVLGTTLSLDVGPEAPGVFDVLVGMDYDPAIVARALTNPAEIDAVAVCRAHPAGGNVEGAGVSDGEPDDASVSQAIADADDGGAPTEESGGAPGPPDREAGASEAGEVGTGGIGEAPESDPGGTVASGTGEPAAPGVDGATTADGDDPADGHADESGETFDDLKRSTDRVSYDELVAQLDETSMPGEFQDDVDLAPIIEDDGRASGPGGSEGGADAGGQAVPTGDGGQHLGTGEAGGGSLDPDRVVDALVTALEEDALADEQRRAIADAFESGPPKTLLVRLDHLQREVDELTAYKDSLEGFIDEYGAGEGLVQQVREVLEQFTEDVAELEAAVASVDDRVDDLSDVRSTVRGVDDRLAEHRARLDELAQVQDQVTSLEERLSEVGTLEERVERVEALDDRVADVPSIRERVDDLETVGERVRDVDETVEGFEERLGSVEDELDAVAESAGADVDDATVEEMADDVASIQRRLDAIESWQDRITSVLGTVASESED